MSTRKPDADLSPVSVDSIAEDLFGLNIRGVKSILVLWRKPADYFDAARRPDWDNRFTPSIRLWLSFFALYSALNFWWFGSNQAMIGAFASGYANSGMVLPPDVTYEQVGREAMLWGFGVIPVLQISTMLVLSLIYTAWGERTTLAVRQRFLFAVIVPSASLMPVFLTIMLWVPQHMLTAYGLFLALVTWLIDFMTGYRGGFAHVSKTGRAWRAGLLAFIVVLLNTGTSIAAQIAGIVLIGQKYAIPPAG
ncbi:MAG: hypothetical protein AAF437_16795 [Pseudomonadota bacterium]